jgi:hypothetical protein
VAEQVVTWCADDIVDGNAVAGDEVFEPARLLATG